MRIYCVPFSGSFTAQIDLVELVGAPTDSITIAGYVEFGREGTA